MRSKILQLTSPKQLFVDDYIVEKACNLRRVLNQPTKYVGNPLIRAFKPWEGSLGVNLYGTVMYDADEDVYKMWYQGYGIEPVGMGFVVCYATSRDGIFWEKPDLGLIEFKGSKNNNIVLIDACNPSVIKDHREKDSSRLYKALFYEHFNPPCSVAFSSNGIHWTKYKGNPVLTGTGDVHTLLGWDKDYSKYVAYLRPWGMEVTGGTISTEARKLTGKLIRVISRSTSEDFINWSKPEVVLKPDEEDPPALEFYGMPVFKYQGIYFGLPWAYHTYPEEPFTRPSWKVPEEGRLEPITRWGGTIDVQLAISRDGINWQRIGERKSFIPLGSPGSIDQGQIYTAKEPLIIGDELWFYYEGANENHGLDPSSTTISLAKLRLDGFVSMNAEEEGVLLTKPFFCQGDKLLINADARGGRIAVSILNERGTWREGLRKIDCAVFDGNSIRHKVTWRKNISLKNLLGQSIRLKFYIRRAKLYSFELT